MKKTVYNKSILVLFKYENVIQFLGQSWKHTNVISNIFDKTTVIVHRNHTIDKLLGKLLKKDNQILPTLFGEASESKFLGNKLRTYELFKIYWR